MDHQPKIALFPGTFDPLTLGHLNIIDRVSRLFDEVIVLVAVNTSKQHLFNVDERIRLIYENISEYNNVRIDTLTDGLVATYYQQHHASTIVRGVRNSTDFDYEFTIASGNARQGKDIELSLIHISEPTRRHHVSRMPSSA